MLRWFAWLICIFSSHKQTILSLTDFKSLCSFYSTFHQLLIIIMENEMVKMSNFTQRAMVIWDRIWDWGFSSGEQKPVSTLHSVSGRVFICIVLGCEMLRPTHCFLVWVFSLNNVCTYFNRVLFFIPFQLHSALLISTCNFKTSKHNGREFVLWHVFSISMSLLLFFWYLWKEAARLFFAF